MKIFKSPIILAISSLMFFNSCKRTSEDTDQFGPELIVADASFTIENDSHQKDDVQKYHSDTNSPKFFKKLLNINDIDFVKNEINTSEEFELKTDKKTSEEYFKKSLPSPESNGNRDQIKQARKNKS